MPYPRLRNGSYHTLRAKTISGVSKPSKESLDAEETWTLSTNQSIVVVEVKMEYGVLKNLISSLAGGFLIGADVGANLLGAVVTEGYKEGRKLLEKTGIEYSTFYANDRLIDMFTEYEKAGAYQLLTLILGSEGRDQSEGDRSFVVRMEEDGEYFVDDESAVIRSS